jgi:hypothetical protein
MNKSIGSVDGTSNYSYQELMDAVSGFMQAYSPSQIHTTADYNASQVFPDHSDHIATGRLVSRIHDLTPSLISVPVTYYLGYPVRQHPANVSGQDLQDKAEAFLTYAQYDLAVCQNLDQCLKSHTLGEYLQRQYTTGE